MLTVNMVVAPSRGRVSVGEVPHRPIRRGQIMLRSNNSFSDAVIASYSAALDLEGTFDYYDQGSFLVPASIEDVSIALFGGSKRRDKAFGLASEM